MTDPTHEKRISRLENDSKATYRLLSQLDQNVVAMGRSVGQLTNRVAKVEERRVHATQHQRTFQAAGAVPTALRRD